MCTCPGFPVDSILLAKLTSLDQTSNLNRVLPTMPHKTVPVPQWSRIKNPIRKLFVENQNILAVPDSLFGMQSFSGFSSLNCQICYQKKVWKILIWNRWISEWNYWFWVTVPVWMPTLILTDSCRSSSNSLIADIMARPKWDDNVSFSSQYYAPGKIKILHIYRTVCVFFSWNIRNNIVI